MHYFIPKKNEFIMNNARDTNFFTNCWYSEWLLVNKKMILIVDLKTNKKLATTTVCKDVLK